MDPDPDPGGPKTYGSGSATLVVALHDNIPCSGHGTIWWRRSTTAGRAATCPAAQRTARPPPWRGPSPSTPTPWRSCTSPRHRSAIPAEDFSTTHIRLSLQKKAAALIHFGFFVVVCCTKCNTAANSTYTLNANDLWLAEKKLAGMFYTYVDTFYVPTYSSR